MGRLPVTGVLERSGLDALVEEIADLRPLPAVAAHVLQIAEGDQFSAHELAQAISSDPALTARLLRLGNSAYYGFPRSISTVREAVVLLGFRQVRSAALAACAISALPAAEGISPRPFWRHSLTVGTLADMLARSVQRTERAERAGRTGRFGRPQGNRPQEIRPRDLREEAFTAGVLHNVGRLALDQARPQEFAESRRLAQRYAVPLHEAQRAILGFTDAEVGGALARHWQFPWSLATAIAGYASVSAAEVDTLAGIVAQARALAARHGLGDGVEDPATAVASAMPSIGRLFAEEPDPDLPPLLALGGGFETLVARAAAFVEHAAVA